MIHTQEVTTPTHRIPINLNNYDELYISISEVQGTGNLVLQCQIATTTTTTRFANFLTDANRIAKALWQRVSESDYLETHSGSSTTSQTNLVNLTSDDVSYDDKISKLVITTGNQTNMINKCKIKVYGRNLTNE